MMQFEALRERNTTHPEKGPQHRQLKAFMGHWKVEGENSSSAPTSKGEIVSGEETYEWFDGQYFLLHRYEHKRGATEQKGLGWIAYDSATRNYLSYSISSSGLLRIYEVEISDRQMVLTGDTERATIKLSPDGEMLFIYWDHCPDGQNWHSLCNLRAQLQKSTLVE